MKHLLIVDDDPLLLRSIRRVLNECEPEWEILLATSVDQAWMKLQENKIDLIQIDFNMPDKDGFMLLHQMREYPPTKDIPVLVLTGRQDSDLKRKALALGAIDLMTKPIETEDLVARIGSALRLKEYQDELKRNKETLEKQVKQRTYELEQSRMDILWRLAKAGELRDEHTGKHVIRVGMFSRIIAENLGLKKHVAEMLFLASPLHDIGKIGIPDHILLKPGPLTEQERSLMQRHCEIGADILKQESKIMQVYQKMEPELNIDSAVLSNPVLEMAATIALTHHERWDGHGYPAGLMGEEIPLVSRIVAVADAFDALSSKRPYKNALPESEVLKIMNREWGRMFDPEVGAAFYSVLPLLRVVQSDFSDNGPREDDMENCHAENYVC